MTRDDLTEDERKVFDFLAENFNSDYPFYAFAGIAASRHRTVRRRSPALRSKGLAEYRSGLFDDDGMPWGSGYRATRANVLEYLTVSGDQ